eukprot:TRINITY_DN5250_c0_g1_i1.p1 TRINITY_DN5250_c0_g1~~TRINITY_DN5250_c0_g1_i1.p1  ORF type:complete len:587 (+),score=157.74 TRINITY_DN5250_c0_g1_i1:175-1761(+)
MGTFVQRRFRTSQNEDDSRLSIGGSRTITENKMLGERIRELEEAQSISDQNHTEQVQNYTEEIEQHMRTIHDLLQKDQMRQTEFAALAKENAHLKENNTKLSEMVSRLEKDLHKMQSVQSSMTSINSSLSPDAEEGRSFQTPKTINKYQVGECLGRGWASRVYQALNSDSGDIVAIKQIKKSMIDGDKLPRIMREVELLKKLKHPNVVKFIESIDTEDSLYFVLEFIEGGSLHRTMKKFGTFSENLLGIYMHQALNGLSYLHAQGVLHRDIKGDNMLLTKEGTIKLADFGSCSQAAADKKLTSVQGTPHWMAPEVIMMESPSQGSDVWSLACTIIELLTGNPPYWNMTSMAAMFAIVDNPHPPLPTTSPSVASFLAQAFTKDPAKRPTAQVLLGHPWIQSSLVSDVRLEKTEGRMMRRESTPGGGSEPLDASDQLQLIQREKELMKVRLLKVIAQRNALQNQIDQLSSQGTAQTLRRPSKNETTSELEQSLLTNPLPKGWDVSFDAKGRPFFIDHANKMTTYEDPRKK